MKWNRIFAEKNRSTITMRTLMPMLVITSIAMRLLRLSGAYGQDRGHDHDQEQELGHEATMLIAIINIFHKVAVPIVDTLS